MRNRKSTAEIFTRLDRMESNQMDILIKLSKMDEHIFLNPDEQKKLLERIIKKRLDDFEAAASAAIMEHVIKQTDAEAVKLTG